MNKVALLTGGTRGIGLAIVRGLAAEGFTVFLGPRSLESGQKAAEQLDALASQVAADFGNLDVLINKAGVNVQGHRRLDHLPEPTEETVDDVRFVYEANVFAVVRMISAFLPLLDKSEAPRIVNVTSMRGSIGEEGAWVGHPSLSYSSSKTALNSITVRYARELANTKFKINGAAPGHVATDFNGFRATRGPDEAQP